MSTLTPHGACLLWKPELIWLNAVSDAMLAVAFFATAFVLGFFLWRPAISIVADDPRYALVVPSMTESDSEVVTPPRKPMLRACSVVVAVSWLVASTSSWLAEVSVPSKCALAPPPPARSEP